MVTPISERYLGIDASEYDRRRYGSWVRRLNLRSLAKTLHRALGDVDAGALVLDLPCGTGILRAMLLERGYRVVSCDLSPDMLSIAATRQAGVGLVRADFTRAPFRPHSFDAVVCARFLMLLPAEQRPAAMRTLAGLSRGPLIFTINHPYTIKNTLRRLRRLLGAKVRKTPRISRRQLRHEVAAAGLTIESIHAVSPIVSEVWVVVCRDLKAQ